MEEHEYKWRASEPLIAQVKAWGLAQPDAQRRVIQMRSQYYDTVDGLLRRHGAALRLRRENERTVCCLKCGGHTTADGMHAREEYECVADNAADGLSRLPECGAPLDLCTLALAAPLEMLCAVDFMRCAVRLRQEDALCELALDEGELRHGTRTAPLYEIELELRAGGEQPFHALAAALADRFSLIPEPESKLARALRL